MERHEPGRERRLNDAEQRQLFELAARLQRDELSTLSIGEIEEAATEAGIDSKHVQKAMAMMDRTEVEPVIVTAEPSVINVKYAYITCAMVLLTLLMDTQFSQQYGPQRQVLLGLAISAVAGWICYERAARSSSTLLFTTVIATHAIIYISWFVLNMRALNVTPDLGAGGELMKFVVAQLMVMGMATIAHLGIWYEYGRKSKAPRPQADNQ